MSEQERGRRTGGERPDLESPAPPSAERRSRARWRIVWVILVVLIAIYREWVPFGGEARALAMLMAGALFFSFAAILLVTILIVVSQRLWRRDFRGAGYRLGLALLAALVFFALPERKLVETVNHFFARRSDFENRVTGGSYAEVSGPHPYWKIVYSRSDDPEVFVDDTVSLGACSERGRVEWKLDDQWYVCRVDLDVP